MKLRNWLARVMAGRYGMDQLGRFLYGATVVLMLLSLLSGRAGPFWLLGLLCCIWSLWRCMSRNTARRRRENEAYLRLKERLLGGFRGAGSRFRQRKEYRFFRCPSCRTWLRVPRNKGRIQITCRQCGERFVRKT